MGRVGYCFGAPYVMDLLAEDWLIAGAFAHPTFLDEDHFKKVQSQCQPPLNFSYF